MAGEILTAEDRVRMHKENAVKELDLMHRAIESPTLPEMVNVSKLVEDSDKKRAG